MTVLERVHNTLAAAAGQNDWTAPTAPAEPPPWPHGAALDSQWINLNLALGHELKAVYDSGVAVEYIHFGHVHPDNSRNFEHESKDDTSDLKLSDKDRIRAIQFRAGLEREAILLSGFMTGIQLALDEIDQAQGGLGDASELIADVAGGFGGNSETKAGDLNAYGARVKAIADKLNVESTTYKLIHKCGVDLEGARAEFIAYRCAMLSKPLGSQKHDIHPPNWLKTGAGALSDITHVVAVTLSKPLHIWLALLLRITDNAEWKIEEACRAITIDAIKENWSPVFPVWFDKDTSVSGAATISAKSYQLPAVAFPQFTTKVNQGLKSAQTWYTKQARPAADRIGGVSNHPETASYLRMAFDNSFVPDPKTPTDKEPPKELASMVEQAFETATGLNLPPAVRSFIKGCIEISETFVLSIYEMILADPNSPITDDAIYAAAEQSMIAMYLDACTRHRDELNKLRFQKPTEIDGLQLGVQGLFDNAAEGVAADLDPILRPIFKEMSGGMASVLEAARLQAIKAGCLTMEVFLGLLPYMIALNFRDTFFPVWQSVVDTLLQANSPEMKALSKEVNILRGQAATALQGVDKFRGYLKKAAAVRKAMKLKKGQHQLSLKNIQEYADTFDKADDKLNDEALTTHPAMAKFFPFTERMTTATGDSLTLGDYQAVRPEEKW